MTIATLARILPQSRVLLSRKQQRLIFILALLFSDAVALSLAFAFAYIVRFQSGLPFFEDAPISRETHLWLAAALLPIWLIVFAFFQLYNLHYLLGGTQEYSRIFNACSVALTLLILGTFLVPVIRVARGWVALAWIAAFLLVSLERFLWRRVAYRLRVNRRWLTWRTLIIGTDEEARAIARQLFSMPTCGSELVGFIDSHEPIGKMIEDNLAVVGSVEALPSLVATQQIEEMIVSTSALPRREMLDIFQMFGNSDQVELRFSPGLFEIFTTGVRVKELGSVPLVSMNKVRLDGIETAIKTLTDYLGALSLLLLFSPVFVLIVVLIKRDSPGPVFYRRRVIGRGGRAFNAYKFRTMYVEGNEMLAQDSELARQLAANHKLKRDPRVTRVGKFLRRFSLDEIPQLLNVLSGQMSLVGPRMIAPEEVEKYGAWRWNLLTVKPGITGLWQVKGRSDLSYDERVRLDMYYIRNYTTWLDLQVLWQTIPVVLRGTGAY